MGDLRAQIAAVKMGERRFIEMIEKYGREPVLLSIEAIMDQSEERARARIRDIPDGSYEAESYMDDDGVTVGKRIPIRVRVEVKGDRMKVDPSVNSAIDNTPKSISSIFSRSSREANGSGTSEL